MRDLLLVMAMFVFGLAITLGTASVIHDVAVARGKGAQSDRFEVDQIPKPTMAPSRQSRSSAAHTPYDSHLHMLFWRPARGAIRFSPRSPIHT